MNRDQLIEEITRLVMEELGKAGRSVSAPTAPGQDAQNRRILILLDDEMEEPLSLFDVLGKTAGSLPRFSVYVPEGIRAVIDSAVISLPLTFLNKIGRGEYGRIVRPFESVILPHLSVTSLTKMANLIGDEVLPGVAISALLAGKPVTVCTDNIQALKFEGLNSHSRLMNMIRLNLKTLEELGFRPAQIADLPDVLREEPAKLTAPLTGAKCVITREDVMTATARKEKVLNFPRGTIVTPLAHETAKTLGISINIV